MVVYCNADNISKPYLLYIAYPGASRQSHLVCAFLLAKTNKKQVSDAITFIFMHSVFIDYADYV